MEKERKERIERLEKEKIEKERKEKIEKEKEKQERIFKEKKERNEKGRKNRNDNNNSNNNNNNDDDIFSKPIKINSYIQTKNKSYLKRIERDNKKNKINNFIKLLYRKCYLMHYPFLIYHLKILEKLYFFQYRLQLLKNIVNKKDKKKLKKALKKYRENVLNEKVKEEILKKNLNLLIANSDENNDDKLEKNQFIKTSLNNSKIKGNQYELNDVIIENENEDEFNSIEEKIVLKGKKKIFSKKNNNNSLLKKIVNKKIDLDNKNKYSLLEKYFKRWHKYTTMSNDNSNLKMSVNLHSPDMEIRGKSKKKHIRVKINRAITSKTSIGSLKSEGKSNNSSIIHSKKMRIKNIVVNSSAYLTTSLLSDNNANYNNMNPNKQKAINLLCLLDRIDNKHSMYRYFKYWKKK